MSIPHSPQKLSRRILRPIERGLKLLRKGLLWLVEQRKRPWEMRGGIRVRKRGHPTKISLMHDLSKREQRLVELLQQHAKPDKP
jgi:hypothetical protein